MGKRFDDRTLLIADETIRTEIACDEGEALHQLWLKRYQVGIMAENIAKYALASGMAVAKPALRKNFLVMEDQEKWHKDVELMDGIFLCHRPMVTGAEFAVIQHDEGQDLHIATHRAWSAVAVLQAFIRECNEDLHFLTVAATERLKDILARKYPAAEAASLADQIVCQFGPDIAVAADTLQTPQPGRSSPPAK